MKRIFSLLLILCLLTLSGCTSTPAPAVELTQRLIDGSPTWIFDFTYTNDTRQLLQVVALEIISDTDTEQATGQMLVTNGLAAADVIAPGETYALFLTSEALSPQPAYTFVLTLRKPDNTCFSHVVTYNLTDYVPGMIPEQEESVQQNVPAALPSADEVIPLEPENGSDWHFIFDFLNETGETITLETMEVVNLVNGQAIDTIPIPAGDLMTGPVTVQPGEPFFLEDWHPVVSDFNGRIYRFHFTTASGGSYMREYAFDLLGSSAPTEPWQPIITPDASSDVLLPVFADNEYHWQFISSFVNEGSEPLTFQELHIVDFFEGQMLGDTLLTLENLQHIQTSVEAGQSFLFEDWHPMVDFFDERHYVFIFTTPAGNTVEYSFEYTLSMDTTQRRDPQKAQSALLPQIDYANDDGRDLIALRHDASFSMQVAPDVYWVPAAALGGSRYTNREIYSLLSLSPEDKQSKISTLYEALQLYEISDFTPSDDNIRIREGSVNWEHHKPGYYAVTTNTGCCATDSNWLNYILKDDYEEIGFIATSQRDGNGHVYNYIKHEGWYYFIDLTSHRACDNSAAIENGSENSYYTTDFVLSNIHRAASPEAFANYVQDTFNDPPGLMFRYTDEDCLALDSVHEQNGITILYGVPKDVSVDVVFDDPNDSLFPGFTDPPARKPDWSKSPSYSFPGA